MLTLLIPFFILSALQTTFIVLTIVRLRAFHKCVENLAEAIDELRRVLEGRPHPAVASGQPEGHAARVEAQPLPLEAIPLQVFAAAQGAPSVDNNYRERAAVVEPPTPAASDEPTGPLESSAEVIATPYAVPVVQALSDAPVDQPEGCAERVEAQPLLLEAFPAVAVEPPTPAALEEHEQVPLEIRPHDIVSVPRESSGASALLRSVGSDEDRAAGAGAVVPEESVQAAPVVELQPTAVNEQQEERPQEPLPHSDVATGPREQSVASESID
eukprot:m51a1_g12900 hypothetical protein (271) ;mRNA; r:82-1920